MSTPQPIKNRIKALKAEYDKLRLGKESLLAIIDEAETPEQVYNSNAIENSTLTLPETEVILLEMAVSKKHSLREVYEVQNLAKIMTYIRQKATLFEIGIENITFLHQMLMNNVADNIAGRFRENNEYVRVGTHIAPPPAQVKPLVENALVAYSSNQVDYFLDTIARFHLEFETIHPFNDGNGRIGRIIINWQLQRLDYPIVILRDKEKDAYYQAFNEYRSPNSKTKIMERILDLAVMEALHKRLAYLKSAKITTIIAYAKKLKTPAPVLLNAAKRQTIPAFREKGIWKIGV